MNWKEFLKPDWRKVLIFVVIGFLVFIDTWRYETSEKGIWVEDKSYEISKTIVVGIRGASSCYHVPTSFKEPPVRICTFSLNPLIWLFPNVKINVEGGMLYIKLLIATYLIPLLYWYLLSCLLIWIYDKVKKK